MYFVYLLPAAHLNTFLAKKENDFISQSGFSCAMRMTNFYSAKCLTFRRKDKKLYCSESERRILFLLHCIAVY